MAEKELGAKFDIRDFHGAVLQNGPLPLEMLGESVGAWLAGAR
jgi:uncharacterized protein (DUF885 family)